MRKLSFGPFSGTSQPTNTVLVAVRLADYLEARDLEALAKGGSLTVYVRGTLTSGTLASRGGSDNGDGTGTQVPGTSLGGGINAITALPAVGTLTQVLPWFYFRTTATSTYSDIYVDLVI